MNDVTAHATTSWAAFYTESSLDEKSVTRFLLRITSAHGCQGGGECLYTRAGIKIPASAQITFKYLLKNWLYRVHIFSLNIYHSLSLLNNAANLKFSGRVTVFL